jgi:hypothetical protein
MRGVEPIHRLIATAIELAKLEERWSDRIGSQTDDFKSHARLASCWHYR